MTSIEKFTNKIEQIILELNNKIAYLNNLLSEEILLDDTVWNLNEEQAKDIISKIGDKLTDIETKCIIVFSKYAKEEKQIKKATNGLSEIQRSIFGSVFDKLNAYNLEKNNENVEKVKIKIDKYKSLLSKFNRNDILLIDEFDLIEEILRKDEFTTLEKIEIYNEINKINGKIYDLMNQNNDEEENVLSEDDLEVTNLQSDELNSFLIENEIKCFDDVIYERRQSPRYSQLLLLYNKLSKYGKYDKMQSLIDFIKSKNLEFVFNNPEILTNTLLYSSVELLQNMINVSEENGMDWRDALLRCPVYFYPSVRMNKKSDKNSTPGENNSSITGGLSNYENNIKFLNSKNITCSDVLSDCVTFFSFKASNNKKNYEFLQKYLIPLKDQYGRTKKGFSALKYSGIFDNLDIGIECGCYEYYKDNITVLIDGRSNMYRIKLAEKQNYSASDFFSEVNMKNNSGVKKVLRRSALKREDFGKDQDETFNQYSAVTIDDYIDSDTVELYDKILKSNENINITDISEKDYYIQKLDNVYMKNDLIYDFGGVIISRLKVLRFYQTLISSPEIEPSYDVLLYVITKLSMLDEEEMNIIISSLKSLKIGENISNENRRILQ